MNFCGPTHSPQLTDDGETETKQKEPWENGALWTRSLYCPCADPVKSAGCRVSAGSPWDGTVAALAPGDTPMATSHTGTAFLRPGLRPARKMVNSEPAVMTVQSWMKATYLQAPGKGRAATLLLLPVPRETAHQKLCRWCGIVLNSSSYPCNWDNYFFFFLIRHKGIFQNDSFSVQIFVPIVATPAWKGFDW